MKPYNVLFLCTGNSARSILAEAYLNAQGRGRFKAYSAGSHPTGKVNPFAVELLAKQRIDVGGVRSKSWEEFAALGAPARDFVVDPAAVPGPDEKKRKALLKAFTKLATRINLFLNLPIEKLDRLVLKKKLDEIGRK